MRRSILSAALILASILGFAQSNSPEALYERGLDALSGSGPSRSDRDAVDYLRRSADLGYGPAQTALGYLYDMGSVVVGNQAQGIEWNKKAAGQGDVLASWMVGRRYYLGGGVPQDIDAAKRWLEPAANQGNAFAAYYLARIYADGDYNKAPALFKTAADQGIPPAQYFYAKALKEGRGIALDRLNAYTWFVVALDAGYITARSDLNELDGSGYLSQSQIAEAKSKARELEITVARSVSAHGCTGWDGEFDEWPSPPPVKLQRFCR